MKFKDLLVPLGLSLIIFLLINKFFFAPKPQLDGQVVRSGQRFTAPTSKQAARPLNREIDFIDEKQKGRAVKTKVETDLAKYVFTTNGAALDRLEMKHNVDGQHQLINTVFPVAPTQREDSCFLVALDEKSPFYYDFVGKTETDSEIQVKYRYSSSASDVNVNKTYTIFKETNKLNLTVEVEPKKGAKHPVEVRIFFPSPLMHDVADAPSAVIESDSGKIQKISGGSLKEQDGWHTPLLFGAENKYYSTVLVEDRDKFAQRAYYRASSKTKIFAILEGPTVSEKTSWTVSFYVGPKEERAMALVDPRLEQTLGYAGLLAPVSKILLALLNFIYKYVHNYGWAIIILTLLVRLLLLPFTYKSGPGASNKHAELQRKLRYLDQKYKHDKETLAREKAALIKKHGMPGLGGCLPLLLQFPLFIALSSVLRSSIQFYHAPFLIWSDLSAKDPYYILPLLMAGTMLVQGLIGPKESRTMFIVMAIAFGALFQGLSAGLLLYIFVSTLLGLVQMIVQKKLKAA